MKLNLPEWHADARKMRTDGLKLGQIQNILALAGIEVSLARISQVTNYRWENFQEVDAVRKKAANRELTAARKEGRLPDLKSKMIEALHNYEEEKKAMAERIFEVVPPRGADDTYQRVRITCAHSGCKETMIFSRRGAIHPTHASRWFTDKGWSVGRGPGHDLCPEHYGKPHTKKKNGEAAPEPVQMEKLSDTAEGIRGPSREWPRADGGDDIKMKHENINDSLAMREMTRADKRLITAKLEEVYMDEQSGYRRGWNDQRVAGDMGVPKEWVTLIRDDTFGPEVDWSAAIRDEIRGLGVTCAALQDQLNQKSGEIAALIEEGTQWSIRFQEQVNEYTQQKKQLEELLSLWSEKAKELNPT